MVVCELGCGAADPQLAAAGAARLDLHKGTAGLAAMECWWRLCSCLLLMLLPQSFHPRMCCCGCRCLLLRGVSHLHLPCHVAVHRIKPGMSGCWGVWRGPAYHPAVWVSCCATSSKLRVCGTRGVLSFRLRVDCALQYTTVYPIISARTSSALVWQGCRCQ